MKTGFLEDLCLLIRIEFLLSNQIIEWNIGVFAYDCISFVGCCKFLVDVANVSEGSSSAKLIALYQLCFIPLKILDERAFARNIRAAIGSGVGFGRGCFN